MRILMIGAGAVGSYLGGYLALAGNEVTLLGRQPLVDAVRQNGLRLRLVDGDERIIKNIHADSSLTAVWNDSGFDWIGFAMKAYDTVATIIELQDVVRDKTPPPIVSFQNGVGNEESIGAAFGEQNVVAATLTTAVSIPEYGIVVEEKQRGVAIGMDAPDAEVVAAAFEATLLETTRIQTGASLKWSKLLLNMLANATCAILDMSPGEVFKNPDLFQIERDALREALGIMKIKGIPPASLPGADVRTLGHGVSLLPAWALRPLLGSRVSGGRGDKLPSLHLALRQNHSRSEVPWLNGGVVQAAESLGRLVPVNHALALTLSDIITGRAPWDMFRNQPDMLISAVNAAQRKAR